MSYQHNESRRHKFSKPKYRVTNWPKYNAALQRRGDLTIWFTEEAQAAWLAEKTGRRGGQLVYSDLAIEAALTIRLVFKQALRQTVGLLRSLTGLLDLDDLPVPDYSTLSRRGQCLKVSLKVKRAAHQPLHILVDSSGLKIYGKGGEWLQQKHGAKSRRRWRKLHIAPDAETRRMVAIELITDEVGDPTVVPDLLAQTEGEIASFTADGAYDGDTVYQTIASHQMDGNAVIPPQSTAVLSENVATHPTTRDRHIQSIADRGRMRWQHESGYNRRSLVENSIYRCKTIIGRRLHARGLSN